MRMTVENMKVAKSLLKKSVETLVIFFIVAIPFWLVGPYFRSRSGAEALILDHSYVDSLLILLPYVLFLNLFYFLYSTLPLILDIKNGSKQKVVVTFLEFTKDGFKAFDEEKKRKYKFKLLDKIEFAVKETIIEIEYVLKVEKMSKF